MTEHEWQPARLRPFHGAANEWTEEQLQKAKGTVVYVRPASKSDINPIVLGDYAQYECTRFFIVKESPMNVPGTMIVCEHEILTD